MDTPHATATLLLPSLPAGAFCGIDLLSFTTSPRFLGIKHVPPGWHVVFTGANNTFSLRHGAWFFVHGDGGATDGHAAEPVPAPPELFIKRWDAGREELVPETDEREVLRWRANLGAVWREGLTPYRQSAGVGVAGAQEREGRGIRARFGNGEERAGTKEVEVELEAEEREDWGRLTDCITEGLLARITGQEKELGRDHWSLTSASSAPEDVDDIPGLEHGEAGALRDETVLGFLPIDLRRTWREGAVGRERTEAARDRSWALGELVERRCGGEVGEVVGELQFTFLMVLTLNNTSCLEQWKRLLGLVLTCQEAVVGRAGFFVKFLGTLRLQLEHCQDAEGGLFDLSDEGGNLIKALLKRFRRGLERQTGEGKEEVMDELDDLEDFLKSEHGWLMNDPHVRRGMLQLEDGEQVEMDMNGADEEDESGDYAPVIVDITPELAQEFARQEARRQRPNGGGVTTGTKEAVSDSDDEEDLEPEDLDARY